MPSRQKLQISDEEGPRYILFDTETYGISKFRQYLRNKPLRSTSIIANAIKEGEKLIVKGYQDDWLEIILPEDQNGWISYGLIELPKQIDNLIKEEKFRCDRIKKINDLKERFNNLPESLPEKRLSILNEIKQLSILNQEVESLFTLHIQKIEAKKKQRIKNLRIRRNLYLFLNLRKT